MGEAAKPLLFEGFQAGCHVVLRGGRGTLWHSNLFDNVSKVSKLEEVSHEMLVLLRPRVSSRVSGFLDTSPCLWGKLQNLSFSKVSKQVVMSFQPTNPNAHTYVNGTDVETHGYADTQNLFLQYFIWTVLYIFPLLPVCSVEWKVWRVECEVRSVECKVWSGECGVCKV